MLAWSEGIDNVEPEIMVMNVIVGGELFTDYLITRKLVIAKPKTQINRRWTLPASFPLVGCCTRAGLKDFSSGQDAVALQQIKERGALPMIDRGDIRSGNRPLQQYLGFTAGRWLAVSQFEHKADSLIAKFKEAAERIRDDVWAESPRLSPALVICIIVCLSWAVNHYRDNAITYKAQRDKNARELGLANAAITDMQMRRRCCCARCKYTKELADAKAENDALRDDVAAGRRLHIKAVCQSVREATASGVDNAALPRTGGHRWTDYFTPLITLCKTTGRNPAGC